MDETRFQGKRLMEATKCVLIESVVSVDAVDTSMRMSEEDDYPSAWEIEVRLEDDDGNPVGLRMMPHDALAMAERIVSECKEVGYSVGKPLTFEEACWHWCDWAKANAPAGAIVLEPDQPNRRLSQLKGTTWHLRNVHGDLCNVMWSGRVVRNERGTEGET